MGFGLPKSNPVCQYRLRLFIKCAEKSVSFNRCNGTNGFTVLLFSNNYVIREATHLALKDRSDPWFDGVGRHCYHIGPERDLNLFDGLDLAFVEKPGDADLIVNTGPWGVSETIGNYEEILQDGAQSRVKMVCANPDLEVIRGGRRMICAGALAERYEELGGSVIYYGKPKRPIYDTCLSQLGNPDPRKVLAIGDSLRTDIAGATAIGMDSLLVLGGFMQKNSLNLIRPLSKQRSLTDVRI